MRCDHCDDRWSGSSVRRQHDASGALKPIHLPPGLYGVSFETPSAVKYPFDLLDQYFAGCVKIDAP